MTIIRIQEIIKFNAKYETWVKNINHHIITLL